MPRMLRRRQLIAAMLAMVAVAAATVLLGIGCGRTSDSPSGKVDPDSTNALKPDTYGTGVTIELFERGRKTAEIEADTMIRFEKIDSTMARLIQVDAYDSLGQPTGNLVGDSAVIRERTGLMDVFGQVVFIAEDGTTLRTEYLRWSPETQQVETDSFVRITRDQDWAEGWILRADRDLKRWRIEKDFRGTFFGAPLLEDEL